jgi:hypothetical protein
LMLRQIYAAYQGGRLWARLARKYKIEQGVYVLLMPEDDAELNAAALDHVEVLVADRHARGVVLVHDGSLSVPEHSAGIVGTERWTRRQIDALIAFYEADNGFTNRLLVVSLTKPFGNNLHRLLERQGITKTDLLCLGCLRLRSYGIVTA